MESNTLDYKLVSDSILKQVFPDTSKDQPVFIQKCKKYNRYNVAQDRVFILSKDTIYLVSAKKVHTQLFVKELRYVIKAQLSKEFILQFLGSIDIRINLLEREESLRLIKQIFAAQCPEKGLRVYGIQQPSLKDFKTNTKNACFDVEPAAKFRLLDEEIKPKGGEEQSTPDEVEEQKPDNFKFENRLSISKKGP